MLTLSTAARSSSTRSNGRKANDFSQARRSKAHPCLRRDRAHTAGPFADCLLCRIEALSETITVERDMRPVREKRVAWEAWKAAVGPELESDRGEFEKWWSTDTPADSQEDKDVSRAWLKIIEAVESRGYTVHDLEWEPWGQAAEKEGIPGGWSLRVEPDPSPPGSTGYDWFGGLSWQEVVENIERWLPERADSQEGE